MSRIALFIDGAYCDFMLKEDFREVHLDFNLLAQKMAEEIDILRTYYYHCLPYQSNPPTEEERERFGRAQRFFTALERLPRFTVRLGKLAFRGTDGQGNPIFEQKRVDILLGVDLALLSGKNQITHAALLAGDSDFLPAVEAAQSEGVLLKLFPGRNYHTDLWNKADERARIDEDFIQSCIRPPRLPRL